MTGIFLVELAMGWITVTGFFVVGGVPQRYFVPFFLLSVLGYVGGAVAEELLHRGLLLTNLAEGLVVGPVGRRLAVGAAVALTAGGFALGHAGPEAGLIGVAAILLGIVATVAWTRHYRGRAGVHPSITEPDLRD